MLGTETVARLLGLRLNHPSGSDHLERAPKAARLACRGGVLAREAADARGVARHVDPAARGRLRRAGAHRLAARRSSRKALRFVGYPYVFSGTSEKTQKLWSATAPGGTVTAPGGFDCSGFVWRVYKLEPYGAAPLLASVLKGRTTYAMSGEVARPLRIDPAALAPGDVVFFGSKGPKSKPTEVGHTGIYVGNGWFVHSSSGGVTLQPLQGWYSTPARLGTPPARRSRPLGFHSPPPG